MGGCGHAPTGQSSRDGRDPKRPRVACPVPQRVPPGSAGARTMPDILTWASPSPGRRLSTLPHVIRRRRIILPAIRPQSLHQPALDYALRRIEPQHTRCHLANPRLRLNYRTIQFEVFVPEVPTDRRSGPSGPKRSIYAMSVPLYRLQRIQAKAKLPMPEKPPCFRLARSITHLRVGSAPSATRQDLPRARFGHPENMLQAYEVIYFRFLFRR